ncbi:holo-[acyl-carrier-protein] synthase [Aureococcus anophagefferens]|nr:holo-[acyl-carrier-protein] synthase [Aureococcus anophagefferens]
MGALWSGEDRSPPPDTWRLDHEREARCAGEPAGGAVRWAVRLSTWRVGAPPPPHRSREFEWLRTALVREPAERDRVLEFKFEADRRRALLARLLARRCCARALGAPATIARTAGGKPFAAAAGARPFPNFNFNISHEGDFVVVASEPLCLVGVDVCCADRARGPNRAPPDLEELGHYAVAFSQDEWTALVLVGDGEKRFDHFRSLWACKEAYVKARGDGLAFDLNRVTFYALARGGRGPFSAAAVVVDGFRDDRWRVDVEALDADHIAAVCRGPCAEAPARGLSVVGADSPVPAT